jgi:tricorn protease
MGFLRMPFRGWYVMGTGEDMELNGAVPHFEIWPAPGDMPAGKDLQLDKAVKVLIKDVKKWQKRPQPMLKKASER